MNVMASFFFKIRRNLLTCLLRAHTLSCGFAGGHWPCCSTTWHQESWALSDGDRDPGGDACRKPMAFPGPLGDAQAWAWLPQMRGECAGPSTERNRKDKREQGGGGRSRPCTPALTGLFRGSSWLSEELCHLIHLPQPSGALSSL